MRGGVLKVVAYFVMILIGFSPLNPCTMSANSGAQKNTIGNSTEERKFFSQILYSESAKYQFQFNQTLKLEASKLVFTSN
jgi:hypothetical protein